MIRENEDKNVIYTVFEGDISDLAEEVTSFCRGEYGDRCEFYSVSIERSKPDGSSWKVHEFQNFEEQAVRAVENHLNARDVVRLKFGDAEADYALDFIICPATNTAQLARYIGKESWDELDDDDLVVLSVARGNSSVDEEQRKMIEELE